MCPEVAPDRSQPATEPALSAGTKETAETIRNLVFDLETPISSAEASIQAIQDLLDEPIGPHTHRAAIELTGNVCSAIAELRAMFHVLFDTTRAPANRWIKEATDAGMEPMVAID